MNKVSRALVLSALLSSGTLTASAAWSTPRFILLEGLDAQVPVGTADAAGIAETSRAAFTGTGFLRSDVLRNESTSVSVRSEQTLTTSAGAPVSLTASAGADAARASISIEGPEVAGAQYPLLALSGELQVLRATDATLGAGTLIPVDMDYVLGLTLVSATNDYQAAAQTHVAIYHRTPLAGPNAGGISNLFVFDEIFGDSRSFDGTTNLGLAFDQLVNEATTLQLAIGEDYLVHLWTSASVISGDAGLSLTAFADPTFSTRNCSICENTQLTRIVTNSVPEPASLTTLLVGLIVLSLRKNFPRNSGIQAA